MRHPLPLLGFSVFIAACSTTTSSSPDLPAPPPAATRIIRLGGNLNFGDVQIRTVRDDGVLTVSNDGNDNLEVAGMQGPCAQVGVVRPLSPSAFAVAPGATVSVGFLFAPVVPINCSGTITVNANHTSGTNTIAITAFGRP
jgi:hypothetical protein